jgi:retinol dehydrogenase-12
MNLTSHGHILVDSINYDALKDGPIRDKLPPLDIYNQSKFVNRSSIFFLLGY